MDFFVVLRFLDAVNFGGEVDTWRSMEPEGEFF